VPSISSSFPYREGVFADAPVQFGRVSEKSGLGLHTQSFTPATYGDVMEGLDAAGAASPTGRLYHVALETDGQIQVFDIWESEEAFTAFGASLMPVLAGHGVDPGAPMTSRVHNIVEA